MKNRILAISIILLLTTVCLTTSVSFAHAATSSGGGWITAYTIYDAQTDEPLVQYNAADDINQTLSPVLPGTDVRVEFTIDIFTGGADTMKISTGLTKSDTHPNGFWELVTDGYDMGSTYNPASASTSFTWTAGETIDMVLYGTVPSSTSSAKTINIVKLSSGSSSTAIDQITVQATSSGLAAFNKLYSTREDELQNLKDSGVDAGYVEIYENVLNASKAIANGGDPTNAMALLNALNTSSAPAGSLMQALFLPLVGVMAAVAVIFVVLFLRVRGKVSYMNLVVEDQIKDLEGLTLRASKIDRTMSSNLESVKERLKRLIGM